MGGGSAEMSSACGASCPHSGGKETSKLVAHSGWEAPLQPVTLCCHQNTTFQPTGDDSHIPGETGAIGKNGEKS